MNATIMLSSISDFLEFVIIIFNGLAFPLLLNPHTLQADFCSPSRSPQQSNMEQTGRDFKNVSNVCSSSLEKQKIKLLFLIVRNLTLE